ncbi:hypothetical protein M569_00551, partial [Genlisea aurea]
TTPILPPSPASEHRRSSLEDGFDQYISDVNWAQIFQVSLVTMGFLFEIQQSFISIFTDAAPSWRCDNSDCRDSSDQCRIPPDSWSWSSPATTSIISEWSLQCSGPLVNALPSSSFFIGSLIGGFVVATISDSKIGRKNTIVLSCLIMSVAGVLTALSGNIWTYSAFRFLAGLGRASVGATGMVLGTEMVGKKLRDRIGIIAYIWAPLGFISLPGIAYWYRNDSWRWIYIWSSIPCLIYSFLVMFFGRESPRWLFLRRRREEFERTIRYLAASENKTATNNFFFTRWDEEEECIETHAITILLSKRWSFRRLAAVIMAGFGLGLVYYGLPLGLETLSFNIYLSVALNAASEIPAAILTFVFVGRFRRRILILNLAVVSAISSIVCGMVRFDRIQISLELASFVAAVIAFDIFLIYVLELFPTCVRNTAMSIFRQAVMLGGAMGPLAAAAGKGNAFAIYAAANALYGSMVIFLPETKGRIWADTMDEEE